MPSRPAPHALPTSPAAAGFTLVELLITLTVLSVVLLALVGIVNLAGRSRASIANSTESGQLARAALDMISRDLRSAGYGADQTWVPPQRPIAYVDSMEVLLNADLSGGVPPVDTLAYDPSGYPRPRAFDGTSWRPPIKYRTGAETIRWTLDLNNDGAVNSADLADTNGADARRTPNPNDYLLARVVYGDSLRGVAGDNGGAIERVALVRRPGGTVPPLFTVYLKGSATPWDWSQGPVPAAQLGNIERIKVQIVATSPRADWRGSYEETRLSTDVSLLRNVPTLLDSTFIVSGYVYNDANHNLARDTGESGVAAAVVMLTPYMTYSDSTGYYWFAAPKGSYVLRHVPPPGYGSFMSPDTFLVSAGSLPTSISFADTMKKGGWITASAFYDNDGDGARAPTEPWLPGIRMKLVETGQVQNTNNSGEAKLFAPVGTATTLCDPPDTLTLTSPDPVALAMTDGGAQSVSFGLTRAPTATVQGTVFTDTNENGTFDAGESGVSGVRVSASNDGGGTYQGTAYTDGSGSYTLAVPANNPPGTKPYTIICFVPAGYAPTSTSAISPVLLTGSQAMTGKNFGLLQYQQVTLNASPALTLASRDLIEQDWTGTLPQYATLGHQDVDLVLGSSASSANQFSVWFNQYPATPPFTATPTYTRTATHSVTALAIDSLDTAYPSTRPDVVTGGPLDSGGKNLFVWLNPNTTGNLGYLPTTATKTFQTKDKGAVQAILTYDCAGGTSSDLIVGTKSPTAGTGTFDVWINGQGATPNFTRDETCPNDIPIPGGTMGEVNCMALADLDGDGLRDLIVGTRTSSYAGELLVFRFVSKSKGNRFVYATSFIEYSGVVTSLACADVNGDGKLDIVAGLQTGASSGELHVYRNTSPAPGTISLQLQQTVTAPGIVTALASGDFGGLTRNDIVMGWRQSETSYGGGLLVYNDDIGSLPAAGVDPSGGTITNWVAALTVANFNYGTQPSAPSSPYLLDIAAAVRTGASAGSVILLLR